MFVNRIKRPLETIPGMGKGEDKGDRYGHS
jgi:hypothetical protein